MSSLFALFRVAAGPRIGHGHLRRAETIARALRRPSAVSVRGAGAPTRLRQVGSGIADIADITSPRVVIVDDPVAREGEQWCAAWRRRGVPVVSVHDLGLAPIRSTLAVNGSVSSATRRWPSDDVLVGLDYAVVPTPRRAEHRVHVRRVLVSLGGGPRQALTLAIARAIQQRVPDVTVLVPRHAVPAGTDGDARLYLVDAQDGLAPWFARVDMAVVAGGLSLYEAIAAGVPAIGVAVVDAQLPTIKGFAARRLAMAAGRVAGRSRTTVARDVAERVSQAARDAEWRRHVWQNGPTAVDGRGAARVARAIVAAAEERIHG